MKTPLISFLTVAGLILSSTLQAGNNPNSTRTLTSGIVTGSSAASVPSSHPYSSRSRGYENSGRYRNSSADRSITNYRGGYTGSGHSKSSAAYGSRPDSFPGRGTDHMNQAATDRIPDFSTLPSGSGKPASTPPVSTRMPSTINQGSMPSSIPPVSTGMPSTINQGSMPSSIPPVSTGIPAITPPLMPAASSAMPQTAVDASAAGMSNRGGAGHR